MKSLRCFFVGALLCMSPWAFVLGATTVPVTMGGEFRVDEMGAATYSIPIGIAPGTAGVQPVISLNYSSANTRESHVGVGWSVGGISAIARCPKTIATDGQIGAVTMNPSRDGYCLDGQRLLLKRGRYGEHNSAYFTEVDSFSHIEAHKGASKTGIGYFVVQTRAGEVMCYGNPSGDSRCPQSGPDAYVEPGGWGENSQAQSWALKSVEDAKGNYFFYKYIENRNSGTFYLDKIEYTGNRYTGARAYAYVKFNYTTRNNPSRGWQAGGYRFDNRLLTSIENKVDGQLYRRYTLSYERPSQKDARVLLKSVKYCDSADFCTPSTVFDWQRPALTASWGNLNPFPLAQRNQRVNAETYEGVRIMDINGDGFSDLVWAEYGKWRIRLGPHWNSEINTNFPYGASDVVRNHALTIDADGDGARELLVANRNNASYVIVQYKKNTHSTTAGCPPHSTLYSCSYRNVSNSLRAIALNGRIAHGYDDDEVHVADVDGDGLEDILFRKDNQLKAYMNTSSGSTISFSAAKTVLSLPSNTSHYDQLSSFSQSYVKGSAIDVNGDGRTDIIARITNTSWNWDEDRGPKTTTTNWRLYIAQGSHSSPSMREQQVFGNSTMDDLRATDLNGDGLTDIVYAKGNNLYYRLSTGTSLSREYNMQHTVLPQYRHRMQFIDVNHDGRADFLRPTSNSRIDFYISYTPGNIEHNNNANPVVFAKRGSRDYHGDTLYYGDKNGDGNLDMFAPRGRNWDIYQDNTKRKQFAIKRIKNGFGMATDISYAPITDNNLYFSRASTQDTHIDVFSPRFAMQVVSRVYTDSNHNESGNLERLGVKYQYGGLLMHRKGRGVLGFEYLRTTDLQTNIVTETKYAQRWRGNDFATSGMPLATIQYKGRAILSVAKNTLSQRTTLHNYNGKHAVFPYISKSEEAQYQLNSGSSSSWHVSTTKTYNSYSDYGALTNSVVEVQDKNANLRHKTTTANTYYNNYWPKLHARLKTTQVTKERIEAGNSSRIIRKSSFLYHKHRSHADNAGLLKEERIAEGTDKYRRTQHFYDAYGNKTDVRTIARASTSSSMQTRRVTSRFQKNGRFLDHTCDYYSNTNCHKTSYRYNDRPAAYAAGVINKISVTAPTGKKTHTTTTQLGNLTEVRYADGSVKTTRGFISGSSLVKNVKYLIREEHKHGNIYLAPRKETYFDLWGRDVGTATRAFDGRWHSTQKFYDKHGRLKKTHHPGLNGHDSRYTTFTYDILGRPQRTQHPNGLVETYYYQRYGAYSQTAVQKQSSGQKHFHMERRNGIGELAMAWQYGVNAKSGESEDVNFGSGGNPGEYVVYRYDAFGNLIEAKARAHGKSSTTTTRYDAYGNKLSTRDPIKGEWKYKYNGFGELIEQRTARGHVTTYAYDMQGRQTRRYESNEGTACFTFNKGYLTEKRLFRNANKSCNDSSTPDVKHKYTYDGHWRPLETSRTIKNEGTYTFKQYYDGQGRNHKTQYPSVTINGASREFYVTRTYNQYGYLNKVKDNSGKTLTEIQHYDNFGNVNKLRYGNGLYEFYNYDKETGAIKSVITRDLGRTLFSTDVNYDDFGNVVYRETLSGLGNSGRASRFKEYYTYDALHRLSKRTVSVQDGSGLLPHAFKTTHDIDYDRFGNITYKSGVGAYQYADASKPTRLTRAGSRSYAYDASGNVKSDGRNSYIYTYFDKVSRIRKNGSNYSDFKYGVDRELIQQITRKQEGGRTPTTKTTYFGDFEVVQRSSAAKNYTEYKYYVGNAIVIKRSTNQNPEYNYLHKDQQGSVTMVTDKNRKVIQQAIYDPFGKRKDIHLVSEFAYFTHVTPTDRGYTGHKELSHLGIIHMKGRIYDPNLGRFLQADPFIQFPTIAQNYNRYSYVMNNPMTFTDPSGYFIKGLLKKLAKIPVLNNIVRVAVAGACGPYAAICLGAYDGLQTYAVTGSLRAGITAGLSTYISQGTDWSILEKTAAITALNAADNTLAGNSAADIDQLTNQNVQSEVNRQIQLATSAAGISPVTGGKFANGAESLAFAMLYLNYGADIGVGFLPGAEIAECLTEDCTAMQWSLAVALDSGKLAGVGIAAALGHRVYRAVKASKSVTKGAGNLPVPFDGAYATKQLLGTTKTPGGRDINFHAADRMVNPPQGRVQMNPAEIDQVLDGATNIRKRSFHPLGNTLTIQNRNMPGKPQVIVDEATGNRVITVVNPKSGR